MDFVKVFDAHGMTKAQVARAMKKSPQALEGILKSGNPKLENIELMAKALGISLSEFFACSENAPTNIIKCPKCGAELTLKENVPTD